MRTSLAAPARVSSAQDDDRQAKRDTGVIVRCLTTLRFFAEFERFDRRIEEPGYEGRN